MRAAISLLAGLLFLFSLLSLQSPASAAPLASASGVADGPGIWVNLWNYPQGDLDAYFSKLRNHGIRNLYIQASRSSTEALPNATTLGPVIEASHKHNIRVI